MDERIQVNGFVLLHDGGMSNFDTSLAYNMTNMRKCFHIFQVCSSTIFFSESEKLYEPSLEIMTLFAPP